MTGPAEIELKLAIVKGAPRDARRSLHNIPLRCARIEDVYYDTGNFQLRKHGLVLRLRRDGDHWLQTLKAPTRVAGVVPVRGEWEVALEGPKPVLDLERFDIAPLRLLTRVGLEAAALQPVFRTRVTRHRGVVMRGDSELEVAVDSGELRARRDGRTVRSTVRELELELKTGRSEDLLDLALSLGSKKGDLTLVPAMRSKAERGYALAMARDLDVVRASARGFAAELRDTMTTGDALRAVIRHGLGVVVANADGLRDSPSTELIHQSRVALRRMRSAIRLFDADGKDVPEKLSARLRWLARALGHARDWDVLAGETLPEILQKSAGDDSVNGDLRKAAKQTRRQARKAAVRAVSSSRYAKLVLQLARWAVSTSPAQARTLQQVVHELLHQQATELFDQARRFARLTPEQRHQVRILAKRLRYALDLLAVALPGPQASEYVDALASVQDALGELNDASVAVELLTQLEPSKRQRQGLLDWYANAEPDLVKEVSRRLAGLARHPRPWRGPNDRSLKAPQPG
jgi:triphosphatase